MLDAFVIEEIRRREKERLQRERARPTIEIPDDRHHDRRSDAEHEGPAPSTVIQISLT
jgi:hypothetical protein